MLLGALVAAAPASAAVYPANFEETTLPFTGLQQPMALKFAPDGSVLVAEKNGRVKRFTNLATPNGGQTVIDLGSQVHNYHDRGMLGLAVDPQFITNRRLYVLYTAEAALPGTRTEPPGGSWNDTCPAGTTGPGATDKGCVVSARLSAVTLDALGVGTEAPLVQDWCQQFPSHSIGTVEVGPDGYLYAGAGDGASYNTVDFGQLGGGGRALDPPLNPCGDPPVGIGTQQVTPTAEGGALRSQDVRTPADPTSLSGSIVRVDRFTGAPAPGNPLTGGDANRRRVIAHGLRNPFRFSFRPGTEELWLGDVGWSTFEEVNKVADVNDGVVENFGWPCYEGNGVQNRYMNDTTLDMCRSLRDSGPAPTAPIASYRHGQPAHAGDTCRTGSGSAIAGPRFYPGASNYPSRYDGGMFVADYSRQCVWFMPLSGGEPNPAALETFASQLIAPVDLQIGPGGDLYYADAAGAVRRIRYTVGNRAPRASITLQAPNDRTSSDAPPLTVDFDGRGTTDADGDVITYAWDLDGDGDYDDSTAADPPARTFTTAGTFTVRLRATDALGASNETAQVVTTQNTPPQPQIVLEAGEPWSVGDRIAFRGSATDSQDGTVPAARLRWVVTQEHCVDAGGCHTHPVEELEGVAAGEFAGSDHPYPSFHRITLTATDAAGASATTSLDVRPRESRLTLAGRAGADVVGGLDVRLNGEDTDGAVRSLITNSRNQLFAPSPQRVGLDTFHFRAWSTGNTAAEWLDYAAPPGTTALYADFDRAPRALRSPAVTGTAAVGQTLWADDGGWAGEPAPGLTRSWQRCDANGGACADIPGASGPAYTAAAADAGRRLRLVVAAENRTPEPPAIAASPPTGVVAAAGAGPGTPPGAGPAVLRLSGATRQRALRTRAIKLGATCGPRACSVRASATLRLRGRRIKLSSPLQRVPAGRSARLRLALSASTRRALAAELGRRRSVTLTVVARATASDGRRLTTRRQVKLVR